MVAMKNASFALFVICSSCQWFASNRRLWDATPFRSRFATYRVRRIGSVRKPTAQL